MKLDARQIRRMLLVGAVPLPKPFPSTGGISLESIKVAYSRGTSKRTPFVVLQERHRDSVTRLIPTGGVAALFIPGRWIKKPKVGWVFQFSKRCSVHNFDRGEWFLGPDITAEAIRARLRNPKLAIHKRGNPARGVVFVNKSQSVISFTETVQMAGSIGSSAEEPYCCDPTSPDCCCCCDPSPNCDWGCCGWGFGDTASMCDGCCECQGGPDCDPFGS